MVSRGSSIPNTIQTDRCDLCVSACRIAPSDLRRPPTGLVVEYNVTKNPWNIIYQPVDTVKSKTRSVFFPDNKIDWLFSFPLLSFYFVFEAQHTHRFKLSVQNRSLIISFASFQQYSFLFLRLCFILVFSRAMCPRLHARKRPWLNRPVSVCSRCME